MIALICILIPALIMMFMREKCFNSHENLYKSILVYMLDVLILNGLMGVILCFIFHNSGHIFSKLNHYFNFACKYFGLAVALALLEPLAEKLLKNGFCKTLPIIRRCLKSKLANRIILSLVIVIVLMIIGSFKEGYHVDEMFTLGLSNHQWSGSIGPEIEDGTVYTGQQLWQEYTMVLDNNRFNYENVIENQTHDVHPPLYYAVVHTVFSLFPGTYSMWFLLLINVGLALIVFWQLVWMFRFFIKQQELSILFSMLFIFTMGFVNSVVFFRMYVLLAAWTNALIMLFCKYRPEDNNRWQYYVLLLFILLGGTMTQYYFIIFACFTCGVYAIRTALEKNWEKIALSCLCVAIDVGIATLIFPAMWEHIFNGYRGQEAFSNLSTSGLWQALWSYLDIINLQMFGDTFIFLFFFAIILYIVKNKNMEWKKYKKVICDYFQLVIPVVCYILIIAKIAPSGRDRYVMNIMGIIYLLVFVCLIHIAYCYSKQAIAGVIAVAVLILFGSYKEGVPHLYVSESDNVAIIDNLDDDVPCLYLYNSIWRILPNYVEITDLNEIVFIKDNNLEFLEEDVYKNYNKLLVYVVSAIDADEVIDQLLEQNSELSSSTELFTQGYATAYYLE